FFAAAIAVSPSDRAPGRTGFRATLARTRKRPQRTGAVVPPTHDSRFPRPMAATSRREKVSAVDTAWLRMDRPHNLMMITGVLMFRERLPIARLKRLVAERFLVFRRFRQRPVESAGMAFWETARDFDLDRHVVHTALPAP